MKCFHLETLLKDQSKKNLGYGLRFKRRYTEKSNLSFNAEYEDTGTILLNYLRVLIHRDN